MLRALYWRMAFAVIAIAAMLCFMLQSHGEWTDLDIPSDSTKLDHDAYDIPTSFNSPRGVHSSNASIPLLHKRILGQPVLPYDQMCDFIRAGKTFYNAIMFADIAGADVIFSQKLGPDRESTQWQRPNLGSQMGTMWTNTDISGTLGPSIASIRGCLEGLQVGVRPAGVQGQPWQVPRQVSTGIYPAGPNVGIRTVQDKPYGGQPQHQVSRSLCSPCLAADLLSSPQWASILPCSTSTTESSLSSQPGRLRSCSSSRMDIPSNRLLSHRTRAGPT